MRAAVFLVVATMTAFVPGSSIFAGIIYHFAPGVNGQPIGSAQFAQIAPEVGPKDFKVLVTGSLVGSDPRAHVNDRAFAYLDQSGLGVLNPNVGKDLSVQGQVQLDGKCGGEYLRLTFPDPVQLTFLSFSSAGLSDKFRLVADGKSVRLGKLFPGQKTIRAISNAQGNWPGQVDFTLAKQPLGFAKTWDILSTGKSRGDGIQLEYVGISEIPEPSTLILWVVGLAAAGVLGVRRRIRVPRCLV